MSTEISLKQNADQPLDKPFVKFICRSIYYCGLGDCWYENTEQSATSKLLYIFWCVVSNFYLISVIVSEVAANFREDLTVIEQNDVFLLTMAHPPIILKFLILHLNRSTIKEFLKKLIEDTRCELTAMTEAQSLKRCRLFITILSSSLLLLLILTTLNGVQMHYRDGIPLRTIIAYYPRNEDLGAFPFFVRTMLQLSWWYLMVAMVSVDSLCVTGIILLSFKFRTLSLLFENLRTTIHENKSGKTREQLEQQYMKRFVDLIKIHQDILECSIYVKKALGFIYSFQVLQSIGILSGCLIKLVIFYRDVPFMLACGSCMTSILILTATYMMAAGDITYEVRILGRMAEVHLASQIPTAIFHSGWELCSTGSNLRSLVVISLCRSQDDVVMTAFGIFALSYSTFISIVRASYSFFALLY